MSCVADEKPTSTANTAILLRLSVGSDPATSHSPITIHTWHTIIQERRWPSQRVSTGTSVRSMNGAHRNLNVEISVTRLKKPITSSESPEARSHAESVSKIRK